MAINSTPHPHPQVVNLRDKRLRLDINHLPPGYVYVGRPSKWGNPFEITPTHSRAQVIAEYTQWILSRPDLIKLAKEELKGRCLVCWCKPLLCHADILLEIANG